MQLPELLHCAGDVEKVLARIREHLAPEGTFLLDNGVPDMEHMRSVDGTTREFEFEHPLTGTTITYRITTRYDFQSQREFTHLELVEEDILPLRFAEADETLPTTFLPRLGPCCPRQGSRLSASEARSQRTSRCPRAAARWCSSASARTHRLAPTCPNPAQQSMMDVIDHMCLE